MQNHTLHRYTKKQRASRAQLLFSSGSFVLHKPFLIAIRTTSHRLRRPLKQLCISNNVMRTDIQLLEA